MKHQYSKRIFLVALLFVAGNGVLWACNYTFTLIDSQGTTQGVQEGVPVSVTQDETYTLNIRYVENHRNCTVTPEETIFLLDGSRWRVQRDTQPLLLTAAPEWSQPAQRTHEADFIFQPQTAGPWNLEIVRVCDRGGYTGLLTFEVQ